MNKLGPYILGPNETPENGIYTGSAFSLIRHVPDGSVDLVLVDPPYESLERYRGVGTTARMGLGRRGSKAHDPAKFYQTISWVEFMWILVELWRVLKPNCHAYVMCDSFGIRYFYDIMGKQQELWSNVKPLVWDKEDAGLGYHYRARYEFVMMLDKGRNRRLNNLGVADIFRVKRVQGDEKCCPTQKPLRLFELLVSQSSAEGEVVFDPFMGSGTTARACLTLGRKWLGFEIDTDMAQVARDSLINMGREMFRVEQGFAGDSPCPNENLPTPLQQAGLLR